MLSIEVFQEVLGMVFKGANDVLGRSQSGFNNADCTKFPRIMISHEIY
jgi:hypothetical protein